MITILAFLFLNLSSCNNGLRDAEESLGLTLAALQNQDNKEASTYLAAVGFDSMMYLVSSEVFSDIYFTGFSYQIMNGEKSNDSTVTITVKMTTNNMAEVLSSLQEAMEAAFVLESTHTHTHTQPIADTYFIEGHKTHSWEIHENAYPIMMQKDAAGSWQIADKALFGAILLDGYDPRQIEGQ